MKNLYTSLTLFALLIGSITSYGQKVDLPKGMTEHEKTIMDEYLQSFNDRGITSPPPYTNIRNMAEWEEVQALVITWTGSYNTIQTKIVDAAQEECLVIIHCTDSNNVKSILNGNGVPDVNIHYLEVPYNSIWIRDYFGNTCYNNYVDDIFFVDWIYNRPRPDDDVMVDATATYLGIPVYSMTANPTKLMATGGNWMTDGAGIAFSSELIVDENDGTGDYGLNYPNHTPAEVDQLFSDWMGINTYIKMTVLPYDDIHHIDMHMKLIDEETLLVGEYPTGVSDGPQIEANLQYVLDNFNTKFGTPFKVYRIPQPPSTSGAYPGSGGYYRTYANQTFVNNTVLLPTYREEYDTTALAILDTILPGYNIVPIDVDNTGQNLISLSGAIHCITHTVGVNDPIYISHKKLEDTNDDINPYQATATIMHKDGISAASIWYKTDIAGTYTEVSMNNTSGDVWQGLIPAQAVGTTVYYYIEATAVGGKQVTHPFTAPAGYHKFKVLGTGGGGGSGISETNPLELLEIYPNPASEITVIPVNMLNNVNDCQIVMTNMVGEIVEIIYQGELPAGKKNFFIDAGEYAAGVYQIIIQSGDYRDYKKLVIQ
ncbi:agmatine deiminase family protein [Paracrocinitomix mangrovi]|uniref:agmatine deiminase family protein n=1 Tax=Paracrocinitomix mangrovi TaxID=2862509 RepID=UPI001C8EF85A|nr:agmatine deiminase family protein [Paracrocinitomix mangrovi]UKN00122.1 agmatine deiminase family protein [Paracrocinitomix mangrovi]